MCPAMALSLDDMSSDFLMLLFVHSPRMTANLWYKRWLRKGSLAKPDALSRGNVFRLRYGWLLPWGGLVKIVKRLRMIFFQLPDKFRLRHGIAGAVTHGLGSASSLKGEGGNGKDWNTHG